ncbi:RICIN domain-containing protein [Streptomyces sp. B93]|uniref:RICIN domain-containing protein n=1 Tax=Streptomyces sp. B93 TaxID=2824875 RepID=UPI001B3715E8|nr:ricin-type beta-trefoil lectin domain protein [Streptomyces sp. B93]MBQ1089651.1 ricin-type beta-trefoil lectin domain protein [Streptomyces sp. B93]
MTAAALAAPATAADGYDGVYQISSTRYPDFCLEWDVYSARPKECNGSVYQRWEVSQSSDGTYRLMANGFLCAAEGVKLDIQECDDRIEQKWHGTPSVAGGYEIRNAASGKCVELSSLQILAPCNGSTYQSWKFTPRK